MEPKNPQLRGLSIVIVGAFNPTIFQPMWFAEEKLLTVEEAEHAEVQIIHADVTAFQLPWIGLSVERERFTANSIAEPYFERLVDVVVGTFERLRHTPLRMLGINNEVHYKADSFEEWHELGHRLAPKPFWDKFFKKPGLQSLTIRQVPRDDQEGGYVDVTVEPSTRVMPGVYVRINDHFAPSDAAESLGATKILKLLQDRWVSSNQFADRVFSGVAEAL